MTRMAPVDGRRRRRCRICYGLQRQSVAIRSVALAALFVIVFASPALSVPTGDPPEAKGERQSSRKRGN